MNEIQYIGEHLLPGILGNFFIKFGFVASLLAALSYFFAVKKQNQPDFESWRKIGRLSFLLHGISVFIVIGAIFYAMMNKYYEYQYVWAHVSEELPLKYILSAFWEGQEGSFLLWMFWHVILGVIILLKRKQWEAPVLAVLAIIQAFIFSMILGIYIGDFKLGSSPLLLLREIPDWMELPLFNNADYVSLIKGNGLNPLLQNYWMTIHPPTLFLGFASTSIPFCYAIAGLWTGQHKEMAKTVLSWALFSGAILGTGILMGGVWAYEALTFGGYWAWDPVENMSLVPWIVLVAGIHTNLIAKSTNYSYKTTYIFYILTFLLILYSTFLTRSGVLGESSVHAFTEMGLEWQLVSFIGFFLLLSIILYFSKQKSIPVPKDEEATPSKEFWMFIGSLVLLFSAAMITASTSLPVYNKIMDFFNPGFEGLTITEPIEHFNKYQLWIGVFIGLISGSTQFLRYKEFNWKGHSKKFINHLIISAVGALILTILCSLWIEFVAWQYWLLLFAGSFAIVSNLDYLISFAKGNLKQAASVISHVGFGIMILGVMASGLNKQHISTNPAVQAGLLEGEMLEKNVMLFKGMPMFMSGYEVTYQRDTFINKERYFNVNYKKLGKEGEITEEFNVTPSALYDNKGMKVAAYNPSTKHYLHKDIFTHIPTIPLREADVMEAQKFEDTLTYERYDLIIDKPLEIKDTLQSRLGPQLVSTKTTLIGINKNPEHPDYEPQKGDLAIGVKLAFQKEDTTFYAEPVMVIRDQLLYNYPVQMNDLSMKVRLTEEAINAVYTPEETLDYQSFILKNGDFIFLNGNRIEFKGFDKNAKHPNYQKEEEDIAIGSIFEVSNEAGQRFNATPLYLIRGRSPFNFKDEIYELGLHFRFVSIDPNTESIEVMIAQKEKTKVIPIDLSKRSFRTDYIILETIVFPGINLVWLGSIMMMLGLGIGMYIRRKQNKVMAA
jgi:cytochrome c-type biogenesis protein CcmF